MNKKNSIITIMYSVVLYFKRYKAIWKILKIIYFKLLPLNMTIFKIGNYKMFINPRDNGIGQKLFLTGYYGLGRTALFEKHIKKGDVVLDIGANIGFFTFQMAEFVGAEGLVIAFEPDPRNYELLEKSIKANNVKNIILIKAAVSNVNKNTSFYISNSATANSLCEGDEIDKIDVEVVELDSKLSELNINKVGFVKLDTDGSEPLAIEGMKTIIQNSIDIKILMEYSPGNIKRYFPEPIESIDYLSKLKLNIETIIDTEDSNIHQHEFDELNKLVGEENLDILFVNAEKQAI